MTAREETRPDRVDDDRPARDRDPLPASPQREPGKRGEDEVRPPAERPAPGIEHEPEPDAGNIIPAKERPGTL